MRGGLDGKLSVEERARFDPEKEDERIFSIDAAGARCLLAGTTACIWVEDLPSHVTNCFWAMQFCA